GGYPRVERGCAEHQRAAIAVGANWPWRLVVVREANDIRAVCIYYGDFFAAIIQSPGILPCDAWTGTVPRDKCSVVSDDEDALSGVEQGAVGEGISDPLERDAGRVET